MKHKILSGIKYAAIYTEILVLLAVVEDKANLILDNKFCLYSKGNFITF